MKKISLHIVLVILALLIVFPLNAQFVKGNGEITKQMHNIDSFNSIKVGGARNIILSQGDSFSVEVETDSNLQEYITLEVKDNTLYFGFNTKKIKKYTTLKYYVTAPDYKSIKVSGASSVTSNGTLVGDQLELITSGASDVKLDVDYKNIVTKVSGASDVTLSGKAVSSTVTSSGASEFRGKNLDAENSVVIASGASECYVAAKSNLTYESSGSSTVKYASTPETVIVKKRDGDEKVIVLANGNVTKRHHTYADTTNVDVGSLNVTVVDGDTTQITVGRHTLVVTDDGDVRWEKCKRENLTDTGVVLSLE